MKKGFLLAPAIVSLYVLTACNDAETTTDNKDTTVAAMADTAKPVTDPKDGMKAPVYTMIEKVKTIRMTGDFDRDFANIYC